MPIKNFKEKFAILSYSNEYYQQTINNNKENMTKQQMKILILSYKDSVLKDYFENFLDHYSRYEIYSINKEKLDNDFAEDLLKELQLHKILVEIK